MHFVCWIYLFAVSSLVTAADLSTADDALRECGNLHHLQFQNLPEARGEYANSDCRLKCLVGEHELSNSALNDGFPCPADQSGICHSGQCIKPDTSQTNAARECGNLHHEDFHAVNSVGSVFAESDCLLKCALNGMTISTNPLNEGYPCPQNPNGICRSGHCVVVGSTAQATTSSPISTAVTSAFNATHWRIDGIEVKISAAQVLNGSSYSNLTAAVCVDPSGEGVASYLDCRTWHLCMSLPVGSHTSTPFWNHNCYLSNGPFHEDWQLAIGLLERHDIVNTSLIVAERRVTVGALLRAYDFKAIQLRQNWFTIEDGAFLLQDAVTGKNVVQFTLGLMFKMFPN